MGASGWSYVTSYQGDVAQSLRELRERVFRDKAYHWWDDSEEDEPRPATIDGIWASEYMKEYGTHSILDVSRVVETTKAPSWDNSREDLGTVRPLAADAFRRHFRTSQPSRAQFEALADNPRPLASRSSSVRSRWAGPAGSCCCTTTASRPRSASGVTPATE